jgi:hypothetical protein
MRTNSIPIRKNAVTHFPYSCFCLMAGFFPLFISIVFVIADFTFIVRQDLKNEGLA